MEEKFGFGKAVVGMLKGLIRPKEYIETGKKTAWIYVHLLIIIVCVVLTAAIFLAPALITVGNDKLANEIDDRTSYFSLSEDEFYCDKEYEWKEYGTYYISIDSSNASMEEDEIEELLADGHYETMVIVNGLEILMYSEDETNILEWSSVYNHLKEIEDMEVYDKDAILDTIRKYDNPLIILVYVILVLIAILVYYIAGMIWGLVGSLIKGLIKPKNDIGMSDLMKAVMLIRTPWFIIVTVLVVTVFKGLLASSFILGVLIELCYLIRALSSLKIEQTENNNTKSEAL